MPFESPLPAFDVTADFWSLRFVEETCESYAVGKNFPQPLEVSTDRGVMATVYDGGGMAYAATSDTSPAGLASPLLGLDASGDPVVASTRRTTCT